MAGRRVRYLETDRSDWRLTFAVIAVYLATLLLALWLVGPWGLLVAPLGLLLLVFWHGSHSAYRCRSCGHEFEISPFTDFISPHGVERGDGRLLGWKLLRCPQCHERTRAITLRIERDGG